MGIKGYYLKTINQTVKCKVGKKIKGIIKDPLKQQEQNPYISKNQVKFNKTKNKQKPSKTANRERLKLLVFKDKENHPQGSRQKDKINSKVKKIRLPSGFLKTSHKTSYSRVAFSGNSGKENTSQ